MQKICVIVSGGDYYLPCGVADGAFVIACDKGYGYCVKAGIVPDLTVGDFDSYCGEIPQAGEVKVLPCEKDDTDTMFAVKEACARGYKDIRIYCAAGGRYDHFLANLQTAAYAAVRGAKVRLTGLYDDIFVFSSGEITLKKQKNRSLSVFAFSDKCEGVTIKGAKWKLDGAELINGFPLGASNEWCGDEDAVIGVKKGVLMVVSSLLIRE